MKRALSKARLVLKPLFGAGILAWMAAGGKLDLAQITRGLEHWPLMLAILGFGLLPGRRHGMAMAVAPARPGDSALLSPDVGP